MRSAGYYLDSFRLRVDRFRIPPRELEEMLPQQSLMLKVAALAIEDARWNQALALRTGVLIGLGLDQNTANYQLRWRLARSGSCLERAVEARSLTAPG